MRMKLARFFSLLLFLFAMAGFQPAMAQNAAQPPAGPDLENLLYIQLRDGWVVVQMWPEIAPNHVSRIRELTRQKFYNGLTFHRVIGGFMAQTGDPTGTGTGGSGKNILAEFNNQPFSRGVVGMARTDEPNSADSQFFIMLDDNTSLNGKYTAWGKVVHGMELVDRIKTGSPTMNGKVIDPDKMISVFVAADMKKK